MEGTPVVVVVVAEVVCGALYQDNPPFGYSSKYLFVVVVSSSK